MKKRSVRLLVGVLAVCCLCGVYFGLRFYNQRTEEAEQEAALGEEILDVDTNALTEVSFLIDGEPVSFRKTEEGSWEKEDDATFPASEAALLVPLSYLNPLNSLRTLTEVEDSSEYGFEDPQNVITIVNSDGDETVVTICDTNEVTGNDYLILNNDSSTVYTVNSGLRTAFSDDLYDYAVSEELPTVLASMITGIALERPADSYDIYLEDSIWMVSGEDVNAEADSELVNDLTSDLSRLSYESFVEHNCSDFSDYGLDDPIAEFILTYEEESEEETKETEEESESEDAADTAKISQLHIAIGQTDESGDYYTRLGDSKEVHTISGTTIGTLLSYTAEELVAPPEEETEEVSEWLTEEITEEVTEQS